MFRSSRGLPPRISLATKPRDSGGIAFVYWRKFPVRLHFSKLRGIPIFHRGTHLADGADSGPVVYSDSVEAALVPFDRLRGMEKVWQMQYCEHFQTIANGCAHLTQSSKICGLVLFKKVCVQPSVKTARQVGLRSTHLSRFATFRLGVAFRRRRRAAIGLPARELVP